MKHGMTEFNNLLLEIIRQCIAEVIRENCELESVLDREMQTSYKDNQLMESSVPIWEKYALTIREASCYFGIGEKKLRRVAENNRDSGWVVVNGNRVLIKRKQFERIMDKMDEI